MNEKEDVTLLKKSFNNFSVDKNLIETSNQRVLASTQEKYDNLVKNNCNVIDSQLRIAEFCLDNMIYAPVSCFNVLFLLEILLKHLMFVNCGPSKYKEVDCTHNIMYYLDELSNVEKTTIDDLKNILLNVNYYNEYSSLKYNFEKNNKEIIIKEEDYSSAIKNAKEVLEWMKPFLEKI